MGQTFSAISRYSFTSFFFFFFNFFFCSLSVKNILKMKLLVAIYVLASALMAMGTKSGTENVDREAQEQPITERGVCRWDYSCDNPDRKRGDYQCCICQWEFSCRNKDYKSRVIECCTRPKELDGEKKENKLAELLKERR